MTASPRPATRRDTHGIDPERRATSSHAFAAPWAALVIALATLVLLPRMANAQLILGPIPQSLLEDSLVVGNVDRMELANPGLRSLQSRVRESRESIYQQQITWLDGVRLSTTYHWGSDTTSFYQRGAGWALSVSFNVGSLTATRSRIRQARERAYQAEMDLLAARRGLIAQAATLSQDVRAAEIILSLRNEDLEASRTNLTQVRQQFLSGQLPADQLFSAQDAERNAREAALKAELDLRVKRIQWEALFDPRTAPGQRASR